MAAKRNGSKKRPVKKDLKNSSRFSNLLSILSSRLLPTAEMRALLSAAVACFLSFSLLSEPLYSDIFWQLSSEALESGPRGSVSNIMGPAGATVGHYVTLWFGYAGIFLPLALILRTISMISNLQGEKERAPERHWTNRLVLYTAFLLGLSGCISTLTPFLGTSASPENSGGLVGDSIASSITPLFGFLGTMLILGTTLSAITYLLFGLQVGKLGRQLVSYGQRLGPSFISTINHVFGLLAKAITWGMGCFILISSIVFISFPLWGMRRLTSAYANIITSRRERILSRQAITSEEAPVKQRKKTNKSSESLSQEYTEPEDFSESIVVVDHSTTYSRHLDAHTGRAEINEDHDHHEEERFSTFVFPSTELLDQKNSSAKPVSRDKLVVQSKVIQSKLADFNVQGRITHVHPGPVITMYEFEPAAGIKVGKITGLQDDLAMALRAQSIRIIAPLPQRGSVGIEVPNESQETVLLKDLLECAPDGGGSRLPVPLGKDTYGAPVTGYIADMPHLLLAGATGTGKSVCINAILVSLLYKLHPSDLQLVMIDPKILELSVYEGIPHLKVPVVTDPRKAKAVLQWAVQEMDERYRTLKRYGVRNIDAYNNLASGQTVNESLKKRETERVEGPSRIITEELEKLPKILIVIDELADLMLTAGRDIEELITRLAQKARAAGIHLLLATQRPSVDVITGLIKANFPARVSFRVSSRIDSRTILDNIGAERLLGKGDMLFLQPGAHHLQRVHGAFVSDQEVRKVTSFLRDTCAPDYDATVMEMCEKALEDNGASLEPGEADTSDPLYDKAVQFVLERGQASTSMVQRAFRIGYNRAARIVDTMEQEGIVGPQDGAKPRQIIVPLASNED